jgi:hypothetical protein
MNEEFGFETEAIRTQLERTTEHSVPLYLTSSLCLKTPKTCVPHLPKRKPEISIVVTATNTRVCG